VVAAKRWGEASQALVAAGTDFAGSSQELARQLDGDRQPAPGEMDTEDLAVGLGEIAATVEEEQIFRDRYLETAANLEQYQRILG
jgi:hypothetical protein